MQKNNETRTDDLLKELASDYANYMVIDSSAEWLKLEAVIKSLSSNVEEFSSLLESINVDTTLCSQMMTQIVAQYHQVKQTFCQIDKLESAVMKVERSVSAMETELSTAEGFLGSESMLKTVFKPFLKPSTSTSSIPQAYKPVDIFNSKTLWKDEDK